jgi:hypothetical protein
MKPRYRIRGLSILIVVVAFGLAALKAAIEVPAAALILVLLLGVVSLFVSAVLALSFNGPVRRGSLGYAYFGLAYLLVLAPSLGRNLPTTGLITYVSVRLYPANTKPSLSQPGDDLAFIPPRPAFESTAHLLVAMLFGGVGALLFGVLLRSRRESVPPVDPAEGRLIAPGAQRDWLTGLWD